MEHPAAEDPSPVAVPALRSAGSRASIRASSCFSLSDHLDPRSARGTSSTRASTTTRRSGEIPEEPAGFDIDKPRSTSSSSSPSTRAPSTPAPHPRRRADRPTCSARFAGDEYTSETVKAAVAYTPGRDVPPRAEDSTTAPRRPRGRTRPRAQRLETCTSITEDGRKVLPDQPVVVSAVLRAELATRDDG